MSPISASANLSASTSQQHKPAPLSTNTSFTLSQLPSLRALLAELRPKIATLPATDAGASQSRFTKERSEYVEAQTLRILEHEGVDLNELGEQHDGVTGSSIGGRRIGREEVEALERIVGALNGERRRNEQGRGSGADEDAMEE